MYETPHLYEVKRTWTVVWKAIKGPEITSTSHSDICNWILWSIPVSVTSAAWILLLCIVWTGAQMKVASQELNYLPWNVTEFDTIKS